jgi:hypothetical protein
MFICLLPERACVSYFSADNWIIRHKGNRLTGDELGLRFFYTRMKVKGKKAEGITLEGFTQFWMCILSNVSDCIVSGRDSSPSARTQEKGKLQFEVRTAVIALLDNSIYQCNTLFSNSSPGCHSFMLTVSFLMWQLLVDSALPSAETIPTFRSNFESDKTRRRLTP